MTSAGVIPVPPVEMMASIFGEFSIFRMVVWIVALLSPMSCWTAIVCPLLLSISWIRLPDSSVTGLPACESWCRLALMVIIAKVSFLGAFSLCFLEVSLICRLSPLVFL